MIRSTALSSGALALALALASPSLRAQEPPRPAAGELALPDIAARAKPCVALVTVLDAGRRKVSSGTGFLVSADGRVVTNHHVIEDAEAATATFADGRELDVIGILGDDPVRDIAILKVDGRDLPALPLGDLANLHVGDEIVVFGSPLGLSASLSTGVVAAMRDGGAPPEPGDHDDPNPLTHEGYRGWSLQITAPISPGSSGSPIMNRRGEVVGVAVGILTRGQSLNFGVPVSVVKENLDKLSPGAAPRPLAQASRAPGSGSPVVMNLVISGSVLLVIALAFGGWTWAERRRARRGGRKKGP